MNYLQTQAEIAELLEQRGASRYGGEDVSQLEHALQCAELAENDGAPASLIVAALLHDIGHMLHSLPEDAPEKGLDDHHEASGYRYLRERFGAAVVDPVRLHVAAKRYLCAVDPSYRDCLSEPSIISLRMQGGVMTEKEQVKFLAEAHGEQALQLRRWDDEAKIPNKPTPSVEHFLSYILKL